jgi:hypothetical protein
MTNINQNEIKVGDKIKSGPWEGFELVSQYTSNEAVEDGFLFDLDLLVKAGKIKPAAQLPIKYITTSLLDLGYWKDRCDNAVKLADAGTADRCQSCPTWIVFIKHGNKNGDVLPCKEGEKELNIANVLNLIVSALKIFRKKPLDDYFVSGRVELPNGEKQEVYIAQNETGRYTLMLPSDD